MKWSGRRCSVRRSRVCESREQEEEAYALQAAVTSGSEGSRGQHYSLCHARNRSQGFRSTTTSGVLSTLQPLDLVVVCCRHDPAVETVAGCAKERATLSRQARDGMRRPMEPTGARANLSHDLLDAPHRLVFHHHQQAQRRVHVTPHAIANSPSFEGETSRLLPIAIKRCSSKVERGSDRGRQDWARESPSERWSGANHSRRLGARCRWSLDAHRPRGSRVRHQSDVPHCSNRTWTLRSNVSGSVSSWRWLRHEGGAKKSLIHSRCGVQRHEAAHCSASHPVARTVPSERHFRIGLVATTPRTLVPAQVPDCFVSSSESSSVTEVLVDGGWFLEHMCTSAPKLMNIIGQIWMHASQPFCRWTATCTATTSLVGDVQVAQRLHAPPWECT